ncbi:MAG: DNA mismatch repair endonuclease MutL [Candidatus Lokiarchaeia archaeon]|nr:DNA mismatch repair endonuclease MutL [Candidatus Lokiarchaeia archaeon]
MNEKKIKKIIDAEKIAAGEVVDRPANIVKELIENSIDASANEIRVIVKRAGKSFIQVIDNGFGIPSEELELAFERHTSSKIRSIKDLEKLSTLGFRGEALASIAAVSKVDITSRVKDEEKGVQLLIEGGKTVDKKKVSCPIGTKIQISNLFYNLPARQKFLKTDATELSHITDIIQRYSLAYPELHFIYRHNDLDILNCPASNDLKTTVFHIYGKKIAKFMEPFNYKDENNQFRIYGLLGHPQIAKKNRSYSSLFINRRYIISDALFRAISEAYEGTLMVSKYPFFIIFLDLDPSVVDFNVHPKKLYLRFESEDAIYNKVYNVIQSIVQDKFIIKEAKFISTELEDFIPETERQKNEIKESLKEPQTIEKIIEKSSQNNLSFSEERVQLNLDDEEIKKIGAEKNIPESFLRRKYIISENFPKLRLISSTGQLNNKIYVVLEGINEDSEEGLFILDQHAASERINKEKFLREYENSKQNKQKLISPLKIEVSPSEKIFLESNLNEILKLGFSFEYFGGNTFIIRDIPVIMRKVPNINIIKEIVSDITEIGKDKSFAEIKEDIINYLSCHKSIRGGDDLSLKDIRELLIQLAKCKDSFHCAHGRPTMRFFSYKELDKLFKRIN